MIPLNFKTHFFNISAAEISTHNAKWAPLHDYLQTYSLSDVSPDSIFTNIATRVLNDETFAKVYKWNKVKQSSIKIPNTCNDYCRLRLFCEITAAEIFEFNECLGNPKYDFVNDITGSLLNLLTAEWVKSV